MNWNDLDSNIAKSPIAIRNMLADCRKRKRIQKANPEQIIALLAKAQYNLQVAESMEVEGYSDWAIVASYSAMFSAANAFTTKFCNATAKDHSCIIGLMLETLQETKLAKQFNKVKKIIEKQVYSMEKIRRVRNMALYTVTEIDEKITRNCVKTAFNFVEEVSKIVE